MKKTLLTATLAVLLFCVHAEAFYKQAFTITNNSAFALSQYQTGVTITPALTNFWANVKSDGSDIRFRDQNGNDLRCFMDKWDYAGNNAIIYVRLLSLGASDSAGLDMLYGTTGYPNLINGSGVFEFYDDFSGTNLNKNLWSTANPGSWVQTGTGTLTCTGTARAASIPVFSTTASYGLVFETKVKSVTIPADGMTLIGCHLSTINTIGYLHHVTNDYRKIDAASYTSTGTAAPTNVDLLAGILCRKDGTYKIYTQNFATGSSYNIYEGSPSVKSVSNMPVVIGLRTDDMFLGESGSVVWDWVRVRKTVAPDAEPSLVTGALTQIMNASGLIQTYTSGVEGVQVSVTKAASTFTYSAESGVGGAYNPCFDSAGVFTINFSKAGYYFVPASLTVNFDNTSDIALPAVQASPVIAEALKQSGNVFTPLSADARYNNIKFTVTDNAAGDPLELKVFNSSGGYIRDVTTGSTTEISWDGRDNSGNLMAGGVYLYKLTSGAVLKKKGIVTLIK